MPRYAVGDPSCGGCQHPQAIHHRHVARYGKTDRRVWACAHPECRCRYPGRFKTARPAPQKVVA